MSDFKNTILALTKIQVKPVQWIVYQSPDLTYQLHATYVQPERDEFFPIVTARGRRKKYITIKALMHDIRKVDNNPLVQFHLVEG